MAKLKGDSLYLSNLCMQMHHQDAIFSSKHPPAIYLLSTAEMCHRFSFWGIYYLLMLFLTGPLRYPLAEAATLFGIYTGGTALLNLLGGYIADKWNNRSPIWLGMVLTSLGCFLLVFYRHALLFPALFSIGLGGALFNPTAYSLLGSLYSKRYHIREGGFSIYYVIANLGSCFGLLALGYAQTVHWRLAFFLAGCVPLIGLIPYQRALKHIKTLPAKPQHFVSKSKDPHGFRLKRHEKDRIIVILLMTFVSLFFWIAYNQIGSSITLFALNSTNRACGSITLPVPWLTSLYPFFLALFAFPLARLYLFLRRIKSSASPPMRTALSLFFLGLCFMVLQRAAASLQTAPGQATASPSYLVIAFALMALAELFLTPILFSLVTHLSPHRYQGLLTGCWFTSMGIGLYLGGYFSRWMASMELTSFFDLFVLTSLIPAFIIVLFSKKLDSMRHIDFL